MVRDRFTTTRGWEWPTEQAGDGPPVLALHGVGGGAFFFRGLAGRLGGQYAVTAIDLPTAPAGADGVVLPPSMAEWADGLCELIQARFTEPVVIVGHSLGTILGLEVWRRRPALVRAMVFVGGLPAARPLMRERLGARAESILSGGMSGWGPRISPGVFGRRSFDRRPEVIGLFERLIETLDPVAYAGHLRALISASAADVVASVSVPCLAISGTEDLYAPPETVAAFLTQLPVPCPHVLLDESGHMPFFEQPEAFADALGTFLASLPERGDIETRGDTACRTD